MATDRSKNRVLRGNLALEVVDRWVSVCEKELPLIIKVVRDVLYHF